MSAELAVATSAFYCLGCAQAIVREHFHDGTTITYHIQPVSEHCTQANRDEDNPQ